MIRCARCQDQRWVCEGDPTIPWPSPLRPGDAGDPCPDCNDEFGAMPELPAGFEPDVLAPDLIPDIVGKPHAPQPSEVEADHFETCAVCGQAIDMRDLRQVIYHSTPEHEPLLRN